MHSIPMRMTRDGPYINLTGYPVSGFPDTET